MNTKLFGKTCVGIARVSTSTQDTLSQKETLQNKAHELGLSMVDVFETKESGFISLDKKEGFGMLQEYLMTHNCKIVIVTELSRLARRKIILEYIKQWFIDNHIQLYVISISFSLFDDSGKATPTSDIIFSVFAALAESEMKDKKVRFAQAHRDLNADGLSITGKELFGYTRVHNAIKVKGRFRSKMEINNVEADQIRQIYDWYLNGVNGDITQCSISKIRDECIARGFSQYLHSKRNVNKALKCAFYTGEEIETQYRRKSTEYWSYKDETAPKYVISDPGTVRYPRIISNELFQAVQNKMRDANTKLRPDGKGGFADQSRTHFTLLAKLVKCNCGKAMTGDYRKGRGHTGHELVIKSYRCLNHKKHDSITMPMRLLDFAVWTICKMNGDKYIEHLQSFPFQSSVDELQARIDNLTNEKKEIEEKQRQTSERYFKVRKYGVSDSSFQSEMDALSKDLARIEKQIWNEKQRLKQLKDVNAELTEYAQHLHTIESDKYNMRLFIQRMVEQVRPLFRDHFYTVTEVIMKDPAFVVHTTNPDDVVNGLTDRVYIIMDTKNSIIPKIRYICGPCEFVPKIKSFRLPNSDSSTIEQVFEDEEEVYFRSMKFKPLDFDDSV